MSWFKRDKALPYEVTEQINHTAAYVTYLGEPVEISATPEGIVKFQDQYDKIASELRAMGMSVNQLERFNLTDYTAEQIERKQQKALDYLKRCFEQRYPSMIIGPIPPAPSNIDRVGQVPSGQASTQRMVTPKKQEKRRLDEDEAMKLLCMRLRLRDGVLIPMSMKVILAEDKTYLFVLPKTGGPAVLEDDPHLFPSDDILAKLILLMDE